MKRKKELEDYTPSEQRHSEGDLAYGRCFGTRPSRDDYPANRDKEGYPQNYPVMMIKHHEPRDPRYWTKRTRPVVKNITNDASFQNTVLKIVVRSMNSNNLRFNLSSLRINKDRFTP